MKRRESDIIDEAVQDLINTYKVSDWDTRDVNWWLQVVRNLSDEHRKIILKMGQDYWVNRLWQAMMAYENGVIAILEITN